MAIESNNPTSKENTPTSNSSGGGPDGNNGNSSEKTRRRRNNPRRDGKGSNTQTNKSTSKTVDQTNAKSATSKTRGEKSRQALTASSSVASTDTNYDPIEARDSTAELEAANAEGGIKSLGDQRIAKHNRSCVDLDQQFPGLGLRDRDMGNVEQGRVSEFADERRPHLRRLVRGHRSLLHKW